MADAERMAKIEEALADLAEAALMGSGAQVVRSNPYLCELVRERRERADKAQQLLVEESRRRRAERHAAEAARI